MSEEELREFIDEYSMLISIMFDEIERQFIKANYLVASLNSQLKQEPKSRDKDIVWRDLQQLAEAAAAVSRILKPSPHYRRLPAARELSEKRGKALRTLLKIDLHHVILARNLRNRLIHLDEDIDDWWFESKKHIILRRVMTDSDPEKVISGVEKHEIFECFNYVTREYIYRGESYNTIVLWNALLDIHNKLDSAKVDMRDKYHSKFWGIPPHHPRV